MTKRPVHYVTTDHDKGQGFAALDMTRPGLICDGCNVREPFEHRCHGRNAYVRGERTGASCECPECGLREVAS